MNIIPAIDVLNNKVVRLKKGEFGKVDYYSDSPFEQAKIFESYGFEWIHLVDLEGSKTGAISVLNLIDRIKKETNLKVEFGGGIRDEFNFAAVLRAGADKIIIGSLSVLNQAEFERIINKYGGEKIICASDVNNEKIAVRGWTEQTEISVYDHISYCLGLKVNSFLCTDISTDGMLTGTNINLYKKILEQFPKINLIASGGVKDLQDVEKVCQLNIYGVVIGKAIYENKINLKELSEFGKQKNNTLS